MKKWSYENEQWNELPLHLRHLPIITRHFDLLSLIFRSIWSVFLKFIFFRFYIRLKVVGSFEEAYKKNPKLIVISNHSSHLDAISIAASIPFRYWLSLYFAAAKDYFFSNFWMSFFSKNCIGAIPIDRKDKKGEAVKICLTLLDKLSSIWLVLFPEGTRSPDGKIHKFKRGVSMFSQESNTPILFLYIDGAYDLWSRKKGFASPGKLTLHVGPVQEPADVKEIYSNYRRWVESFKQNAFSEE